MGAWLGILTAGLLNGSFAVPMKTTRIWKFHHIWGAFSLLSMMLIPCAWVLITVPSWPEVLSSIPLSGLLKLFLMGLIWGIAALLYGAAVEMLGVAVGVSILLGLSIVVGALLPRLLSGAWLTVPQRDAFFAIGLVLMVVGVIICSRAGDSGRHPRGSTHFRKGLVVAILGGVGAPLLNQGIEYGISLLHSIPATTRVAGTNSAQWVVWAFFLSAAAITQSLYCFAKIVLNNEQRAFLSPGTWAEFVRVLLMAVAWSSSIFIYATAVAALGRAGAGTGWPVFMGLIVLMSNVWGVILGEWRVRPRIAFHQMLGGSALLIIATFLIARSA